MTDGKDNAPTGDGKTILQVLERLTQIQEAQPVPQQTVAQATYVTPWNPTGKRQRPRLRRRVFENGHPISDGRLTDEEITLLNGLKHGRYHSRQWTVIERDEEGLTSLHLFFPNKTEADRMAIARIAPRGLADLLVLIHQEMQGVKVATE